MNTLLKTHYTHKYDSICNIKDKVNYIITAAIYSRLIIYKYYYYIKS